MSTDYWVREQPARPEPRPVREATSPYGVGGTFGPEPWWHRRGPRNEQEALELAAFKFTPNPEMERFLALREAAPDVFAQLATDHRLALETYEMSKTPAVELGRASADLDPRLVAEVSGYVAAIREGSTVADVDGEHRGRFTEAVAGAKAGGDGGAMFVVWGEWLDAHARHQAQLAAFERAWDGLGLPGRVFHRHQPPAFLEELGRAAGGRLSFAGVDLRG